MDFGLSNTDGSWRSDSKAAAKDLGVDLPACPSPGLPCTIAAPCVISATCQRDFLCHPDALQNCDDGLDCTDDLCLGQGLCSHPLRNSRCLIRLPIDGKQQWRCFAETEVNPQNVCQLCLPRQATASWSAAGSRTCDDQDACTKDDRCDNSGVCKGQYYGTICADSLACTEDLCDGKGGCLGSPVMQGWCLVEGKTCVPQGQPGCP